MQLIHAEFAVLPDNLEIVVVPPGALTYVLPTVW
jgi:hypothetical protein